MNIRALLLFLTLVLLSVKMLLSQNIAPLNGHNLDASHAEPKVTSGQLKLGGADNKGNVMAVNNYYLTINNKPFIPVTGEFHFSRYDNAYWDESVKKMKAGGINVVATYVFWNIHEEREGVFDWQGDKDLRKFVETCAKNNVFVIVRIGPFCHGEIRNGGLPDWLMGKPVTIRSNDPGYLSYVERLYTKIGDQLKGLFYQDGGPVIGIQLENEYQHSAAPWGLTYPGQPIDFTAAESDLVITQAGVGVSKTENPYAQPGNDHMKILKSLAVKSGLVVPIYTVTGWGNAAVVPNETLPVTSAYAYPFWTEKRDLSPFFLYSDLHKFPDYMPVRYKPEDYPVFAAELGSGIMSVYTRRPVAVHKSFDAMINRCLGSGANGIGYYMYHGGSTPRGIDSYFSDEAYGLPKISYDFQAPIGEFGQVREGFHRLKLLHFFLQDFGDLLAPMVTVLAEDNAKIKPENITDLRYAVRVNGNSGFLFLNNFQDDTLTLAKSNLQVTIKTKSGEIRIPEKGGFSLAGEENAVFPFNLMIKGANLIYATAQLVMKGNDESVPYYLFLAPEGVKPEFVFAKNGVSVKSTVGATVESDGKRWLIRFQDGTGEFTVKVKGKVTKILVIPKELALKSYRIMLNGSEHLVFSDAVVLQDGNSLSLLSTGENSYDFSIYPAITALPKTNRGELIKTSKNPLMSTFTVTLPEFSFPAQLTTISRKKMSVTLPSLSPGLNNIYLTIDYTGDTGMGFLDGKLVTDEFYKGIPWQIGLRTLLAHTSTRQMVFYFRPMAKNASYLVDLQPYPASIPDFGKAKNYLKLNNTQFTPEYKTIITF